MGCLFREKISFSRESSQPMDWTCISCFGRLFLTTEPPGNPFLYIVLIIVIPRHFIWTAANITYIYIYIYKILISNSICSLLVYKKMINFYTLTLYPETLLLLAYYFLEIFVAIYEHVIDKQEEFYFSHLDM